MEKSVSTAYKVFTCAHVCCERVQDTYLSESSGVCVFFSRRREGDHNALWMKRNT